MKKLLAILMVMMIAVMAMTGCASEHESEISKELKEQEEALEQYLAEEETGGASDKVPDPNAPEVVVVSVYRVADGNKGLVKEMDDVPEVDDWEITQKLIQYNVLPDTAEIMDFRPDLGIIEYDGVKELTPRQAQAVINTFIENMDGFDGQVTLKLKGTDVLTSGYNDDYENIDDTYAGGANDIDPSAGGPGTK